jgi:hypothetical protein
MIVRMELMSSNGIVDDKKDITLIAIYVNELLCKMLSFFVLDDMQPY